MKKVKGLKYRAVAVVSIVALTFGLCSCGKKDEAVEDEIYGGYTKQQLIEYAHQLDSTVAELSEQNDALKKSVIGTTDTEVKDASLQEFSDGSKKKTLVTFDEMVLLPTPFEYPNCIQAPNNSAIMVSNNVMITPSSNWVVQLDGTTINLYNSQSKVSGVIKVGDLDTSVRIVGANELKPYMEEFFNSMPPLPEGETIQLSAIYIQNTLKGIDATAHTFIDEEDSKIRCGMINIGRSCATYMFCYKGEANKAKDDVILSLLKTLSIDGAEIRIE